MLARYKMHRGTPPPGEALPRGIRQDTRKHTRHILRPTAEMVEMYLASPSEKAWRRFTERYRALLEERFRHDRGPFDDLVALAKQSDVFLGCSCPTAKNPWVKHCHTYLALQFMKAKYPRLRIKLPKK